LTKGDDREVAQKIRDECQDQLDRIVPLFNQAVASMNLIEKEDIAEIRTLPHPPKAIKLVLQAVCILLGVEPQIKRNKRGEYKPSYWKAAISDKVLGDPNLPSILMTFDRNKLSLETMAKVEDILS
jgi:dynein heavy chain, axonemal